MIIKFIDFQLESVDFEVFPKEVEYYEYINCKKKRASFNDEDDNIINFQSKNGYGTNISFVSKEGSTPFTTYQIVIRKKRKYASKKLGYGRGNVTTHYRFYKFYIDKVEDEWYTVHLRIDHAIYTPEKDKNTHDTDDKYWIIDQRDELQSFINAVKQFSKTNRIDFI